MKYYGIFIALLLVLVSSAIVTGSPVLNSFGTVWPDVSITRGGVTVEGVDNVTGVYETGVIDNTGKLNKNIICGFISNPQNMTGGFCDRPPYISGGTVRFDSEGGPREFGETIVAGKQFNKAQFYQLSPNGVIYPSDRPELVYKGGTRYYAGNTSEVEGEKTVLFNISTIYFDEILGREMSLKPGAYHFLCQREGVDLDNPSLDDLGSNTFNVRFGTLTVDVTQLYKSVFQISGMNTDSQKTYLWLTGEDLPECGTSLTYGYNIPQSGVPTIIGNKTLTGLDPEVPGTGHYDMTGLYSFEWRIPPTLKPGNYTIWASSANPSDLPDIDNGSWGSTAGICGLDCEICAPTAKATFTVEPWEMEEPVLDPDTISLDCCNQSICIACLEYPKVILSGVLNIKGTAEGYPLQIWIFGSDRVGDKPMIFSDEFRTFPDEHSSYEIDITRLLLDNGVSVCDLDNGDYYIVVQSKGLTNGIMNPVFDITHERAIAFLGEPVFDKNHWYVAAVHPYSKFPIGYDSIIPMTDGMYFFDLTSENPGYYPLFPVEGSNSLRGYKAFNALKKALDQDFIRDHYRVVTLSVKNDLCREYVDFVGMPMTGEVPLTVSFIDVSTYAGTDYLWEFGDETTSAIMNPEHTYQAAGTYDVTLTIRNGDDKKSRSKFDYITVTSPGTGDLNAAFIADITVGSPPLTVQFIDQSTGNPVAWSWIFGDGTTSSERSPLHTYDSSGSYTISLDVYNRDGMTAGTTKSGYIKVDDTALQASFRYSFPDYEDFTTIQFTDLSTGAGINAWEWNFGDGTGSTEKNPLHIYAEKGCYTVSLKVSNDLTSALRSYKICI